MTHDDYENYLSTLDWSNGRQVHEAQSIAQENPVLAAIYERMNPVTRSRLRSPDDEIVDLGDDYGDY